MFMILIIFIATIFTLSYSVRLIYYIFFNNLGGRTLLNLGEEVGIIIPIRLLLFMTIVAGGWIRGCLFPINFIFLPLIGKIIVITGLSLVFLLRFYILGVKSVKFETLTSWGSYYTGSMWFLPFLTSIFFYTPTLHRI